MNKNFTILIAVLFISFASLAHGTDFNDLSMWSAEEFYRRGDVVRLQDDMYISVIPSRGRPPATSKAHWRKIDYNDRRQIRIKSVYPLGTVVSHQGKHYISLRLNAVGLKFRLDDSRRWMEFTHPGLIYDIPDAPIDPDQIASLIGVDSNSNGIRDDYEREILFSDLPAPVKDAALSAGKVYGALMQVSLEEVEVDASMARDILRNMVIARECRRALSQIYNGAMWEETSYFNTFDRIEAKFVLQNMLSEILASPPEYPDVDHCVELAAI